MSKNVLNEIEWKSFVIGGENGVFIVESTSSGIDKNKLNSEEGRVPYITRSNENNGINLFVNDKQSRRYKKDPGGVISIGLDTQTVFYQPSDFYTGQNIQILRNEKLSKYSALFIIPLLKNQVKKFSWGGTGATLTRLKRTNIMLPVDQLGNPNWTFMEDYIKQELKEQSQNMMAFYRKKIAKLGFDLLDLEAEWKAYKIKDIFNVKSVKGKSISHYEKGETPYVTTSASDNGVSNFVYADEHVSSSNCISVDPIGGKAFYHGYGFVGRGGAGSAINLLYNDNLDQYSGLFMCKMIESSSFNKASYGVQLNGERLKNLKVMLPIDEAGSPHWAYMKKFTQHIMNNTAGEALEYIYIYNLAINLNKKYDVRSAIWKDFFIEDVCEIKSGKDIYERERTVGMTPYITATASNNGIGYFVSNENETLQSRCISVNRNGSVGYSFYHHYPALFSNDTRKLEVKQSNEFVAKFISLMIARQRSKYGYGYKMGTGRLKRQKILLPVNERNSIDYDFMKKYIVIKEIKAAYNLLEYYKIIEE